MEYKMETLNQNMTKQNLIYTSVKL